MDLVSCRNLLIYLDATLQRLRHNDFAIHQAGAVSYVDHPVDKGTQEIAVANLQDARRFQRRRHGRLYGEFALGQIGSVQTVH